MVTTNGKLPCNTILLNIAKRSKLSYIINGQNSSQTLTVRNLMLASIEAYTQERPGMALINLHIAFYSREEKLFHFGQRASISRQLIYHFLVSLVFLTVLARIGVIEMYILKT